MSSSHAAPEPRWARRLLLGFELALLAGFFVYRCYVGIQTPPTIISPSVVPVTQPERVTVTLHLTRGPYDVFRYVPGDPAFAAHPKAVIIFGTGDGGWGGWEDRVCKALQAFGCEMITLDCATYSKTDFDLPTLQADMNTIGRAFPHAGFAPPLILGGWSMGADMAVAAAGGPNRPTDLVGLLLISPGDRSRYGEREPDRWNVPPTGPGTFALGDFADKLTGLRVAQWNAGIDLPGSANWIGQITTVHKAYVYKLGLHDYAGASDEFLAQVKGTVAWILSTPP